MSFVGALGLTAFILACVSIAIVTIVLKVQYEKELKKKGNTTAANKSA